MFYTLDVQTREGTIQPDWTLDSDRIVKIIPNLYGYSMIVLTNTNEVYALKNVGASAKLRYYLNRSDFLNDVAAHHDFRSYWLRKLSPEEYAQFVNFISTL